MFSLKSHGIDNVSIDNKASKKLQKKNSSNSMKCLQVVQTH
jgi:hypothetical protein